MVLKTSQEDRNTFILTRIFLENKIYSAITLFTALIITIINYSDLLFLSVFFAYILNY